MTPFQLERFLNKTETLRDQFNRYHAAHPEVYDEIVRLARIVKEKGSYSTYSIQAIIERIRWHFSIEKSLGDSFKINNNHAKFYSELAMKQEPDLKGFFKTRIRRAA
jgi:hypothetical protein